jgi:hypothetical protein
MAVTSTCSRLPPHSSRRRSLSSAKVIMFQPDTHCCQGWMCQVNP